MRLQVLLGASCRLALVVVALFPVQAQGARFRFGDPVAVAVVAPSPGRGTRVAGWTTCGETLTPAVTNSIFYSFAISDGSGGAGIAWSDGRSGTFNGFASRLDSNGDHVSGWAAGGNALSSSDSNEVCVGAATDAAGGIFSVLTDVDPPQYSNFHDAYLQHRTESGALAGGYPTNGKPLVSGDLGTIGILPDGSGNVFFGWSSPSGSTVRAKLLDPSGNTAPGWPSNGIDTGIPDDTDGEPALDGSGGIYAIWTSGMEIKVQRFNSSGVVSGWPANGLVVHTAGIPLSSITTRIVQLSSGDALAVWEDPETGHVTVQRVTSAGAAEASWPAAGLDVSTGVTPEKAPSVVADGADGALIMWQEQIMSRPPSFRIFVQRVTSTGAISSGWPATGVSLSAGFGAYAPSNLIGDGNNGALAAWEDLGGGEGNILAQHVLASGATDPGWDAIGVVVCAAPGDQLFPRISSDDASGMIVTWLDYADQSQPQVKAGHVLTGGTVSALASLVDASAESGLVRLYWFSPDGSVARAVVERAQDGGGFIALSDIFADGGGNLRFEDRDVIAGASYTYRLAVMDGGRVTHLGEVTLRVPALLKFGIEGLRPNPTVGDPSVAFELTSADRAWLEVLDVAGRRVFSREVGSLGAGRHVLRLERGFRAGVYTIRLVQDGRAVVARAAIMR